MQTCSLRVQCRSAFLIFNCFRFHLKFTIRERITQMVKVLTIRLFSKVKARNLSISFCNQSSFKSIYGAIFVKLSSEDAFETYNISSRWMWNKRPSMVLIKGVNFLLHCCLLVCVFEGSCINFDVD